MDLNFGSTVVVKSQNLTKQKKQTFNRKHKFNIATKFCLAFCRTGLCKKGVKCPFSHKLEKVAICKKFLYGKCNKGPKCFLSHTSTQDNMPDCSFFLKGFCKEENCRYRHVKVNAGAGICKDFVTGFCSKGAQCESLHQFLCKSYFKSGQCPKGAKCTLAHMKGWPSAQAVLTGKKRLNPLDAASSAAAVTSTSSSKISDAASALMSKYQKYRKVNSAVLPSLEKVPSTSTAPARPNREMLNSLLTKRLRINSESNKQIVCQDTDGLMKIDSSTEYIALSDVTADVTAVDAASNQATAASSSQMSVISSLTTATNSSSTISINQKITKKNFPGTDPTKKVLGKYHQASSSASLAFAPPQPAKRAKYFVVDHDEEKLSDYLATHFSTPSSVDSICRPQLKIIPNFLLGK